MRRSWDASPAFWRMRLRKKGRHDVFPFESVVGIVGDLLLHDRVGVVAGFAIVERQIAVVDFERQKIERGDHEPAAGAGPAIATGAPAAEVRAAGAVVLP